MTKHQFLTISATVLGLAVHTPAIAQTSTASGSQTPTSPFIELGYSGGIRNFKAANTPSADITSAVAVTSPSVSSNGVVLFDVPGAPCSAYNFYCIQANAINSQGDIAGIYTDPVSGQQSFIRYANGTFVKFQVPAPSCCTTATGINIEDTVTGFYSDEYGGTHGFLRYASGKIIYLDSTGAGETQPAGINALGDVTGQSGASQGFIRHANGSVITFDAPGSISTSPVALNLPGTVTGSYEDSTYNSHGFVRALNGTVSSFDGLNAIRTFPAAIDLTGDVVGFYFDENFNQIAFLRTAHGSLTNLNPPGSEFAVAVGISLVGTIVGITDIAGTGCPGFLREPDGSFTYFAPAGASFKSGFCVNATAISDLDVVIGNYFDLNGVQHAFFRLPSK